MPESARSSLDSLEYFKREIVEAEEKVTMQPALQEAPQESRLKTKIINGAYIGLNTLSTVAIVFLNKIIFTDPQFKNCQVTTAMYHFTITFLVLIAASSHPTYRLFDAKRIQLLPMLPICLFFAGSIVLSNLSLAWNSVGFFQLTKILTTPCVVLLQYLMFRITTNNMRLIAVAACCIGVAMTNTKEALTNPIGAAIAISAFSITALYQIYIGRQMKVLNVSAPQLLMNQAPISVVLLAFVMPFIDTFPNFAAVPTKVITAFLLSGLVAASINYSQFMIIGRTSPLTFNIVGMAKIIFVILLSYFLENGSFSLIEIGGILLALSGTWVYGQYPDAKPSAAATVERRVSAGEAAGEYKEVPRYEDEMMEMVAKGKKMDVEAHVRETEGSSSDEDEQR